MDRLFGFLQCSAKRCCACKHESPPPAYQVLRVLRLPIPSEQQRKLASTTAELYMLWAAQERLCGTDAVMCDICDTRTEHEMQMRVVTAPNVLFVHPRRTFFRGSAVQVSRHVVVPEREINWPGVGAFELVAVIYHSGNTPTSGHFWCVSRATDGRWYTFDDREVLQFSDDPEQKFTRNVHLMVYTPCGGRAEFAGMVGGTCQPAGEAAPAPASDSMHPGIAVEQGTGAASVPLPRAARGGPRIVTGFGEERVDDVVADERRRIDEGARRGRRRNQEGTRGRMVGFDGQELDRSAGSAWHAGRR